MPTKPTGRPVGRPKKDLDLKLVERLASLGCTYAEIGATVGLAASTLAERPDFRMAYATGLEKGKVSLRRAQWKSALAGSSRMLTWLGMQHLGQRNQASTEISGPQGGPIQTQDLSKFSDDDLAQLEDILSRAEPGTGQDGAGTSTVQ